MKQSKKIVALVLSLVLTISCLFTGIMPVEAGAIADPMDVKEYLETGLRYFDSSQLETYRAYLMILAEAKTSDSSYEAAYNRLYNGIAKLETGADFYDDFSNIGTYETTATEPTDIDANAVAGIPFQETSNSNSIWQIVWGGRKADKIEGRITTFPVVQSMNTTTGLKFNPHHTDAANIPNAGVWNLYGKDSGVDKDHSAFKASVTGKTNWATLKSDVVPNDAAIEKITGVFHLDQSPTLIYDYVDAQNFSYIVVNPHGDRGDGKGSIRTVVVKNGSSEIGSSTTWANWLAAERNIASAVNNWNSLYTTMNLNFELTWNTTKQCYTLTLPDVTTASGTGLNVDLTDTTTTNATKLNAIYISQWSYGIHKNYSDPTTIGLVDDIAITYMDMGLVPTDEEKEARDSVNALKYFDGSALSTYQEWFTKLDRVKTLAGYDEAYARLANAIPKLEAGADFYDDFSNMGTYETTATEPTDINTDAVEGTPFQETSNSNSIWQIVWGGRKADRAEGRAETFPLAQSMTTLTGLKFNPYHVSIAKWPDNSFYGVYGSSTGVDKSVEYRAVMTAKTNWATLKSEYVPEAVAIEKVTGVMNRDQSPAIVYDYVDAKNFSYIVLNAHNYHAADKASIRTVVVKDGQSQLTTQNEWIAFNDAQGQNTNLAKDVTNWSTLGLRLKFELTWNTTSQCYTLTLPDTMTASGLPLSVNLTECTSANPTKLSAIYISQWCHGTKTTPETVGLVDDIAITYMDMGLVATQEEKEIKDNVNALKYFKDDDFATYQTWLTKLDRVKTLAGYDVAYARLANAIVKLDTDNNQSADVDFYDDFSHMGTYETTAGEPTDTEPSAPAGTPFTETANSDSIWQIVWGGRKADRLTEDIAYQAIVNTTPQAYTMTSITGLNFHPHHTLAALYNETTVAQLYGAYNSSANYHDAFKASVTGKTNWATLKASVEKDGEAIDKITGILNRDQSPALIYDYVDAQNFSYIVLNANDGHTADKGSIRTVVVTNGSSHLNSMDAWKVFNDVGTNTNLAKDVTNWSSLGLGLKFELTWSDSKSCYTLTLPETMTSSGSPLSVDLTTCTSANPTKLSDIYISQWSYGLKTTVPQTTGLVDDISITYGNAYVPPSHNHAYERQVTEGTTYLKAVATCTTKAVYYYVCNECDLASTTLTYEYGNILGHDESGAWQSDGAQHWKECQRANCPVAGKIILKAGCTEAATWSSDDTYHWYACTTCGKTVNANKGEHNYTGGVLKCIDCGKTDPSHTHTFDKTVVHEDYLKSGKNCTSYAVYYKSCGCGLSSEGQTGEATFDDEAGGKNLHTEPTTYNKTSDTEHWKECTVCNTEITGTRDIHRHSAADYGQAPICACGHSNGSAKAVDFLPVILGCKILKASTADKQTIRIDVNFSDIIKANGSQTLTMKKYGIAIAPYTGASTQKADLIALAKSGAGASEGVITKLYEGTEPALMQAKVSGISQANFGKGFVVIAFVVAEDTEGVSTYYFSEGDNANIAQTDGMLLTSVRGVMKRTLADTTNGYGYMLDTAISRYFASTDFTNDTANTSVSKDDLSNFVKKYIGVMTSDLNGEQTALAKKFVSYVFYYCYTPNEIADSQS